MNKSSTHPTAAIASSDAGSGSTFNGVGYSTGIAGSSELVSNENAFLLSDIEARLAEEVRGLILSLTQFSGRAQSIGKEIPIDSQFCKLITSTLQLFALQVAVALGQGLNKPIFFDDGAHYLADLGLSLNDFIREIDLDGRKFMAIALIDKRSADVLNGPNGAK